MSSIKKCPFEVVFGQKPNRLDAFGIEFNDINEEEITDIIEEDHRENNVIEQMEEGYINFNVHKQSAPTASCISVNIDFCENYWTNTVK